MWGQMIHHLQLPALGKISNLFNSLQSAITDENNLTPPILKNKNYGL